MAAAQASLGHSSPLKKLWLVASVLSAGRTSQPRVGPAPLLQAPASLTSKGLGASMNLAAASIKQVTILICRG